MIFRTLTWGEVIIMKLFFAALALVALSPVAADTPLCGTAYAASCCKICRAGKACGDSCISRNKVCRKGKGCACNA